VGAGLYEAFATSFVGRKAAAVYAGINNVGKSANKIYSAEYVIKIID